jgi:hypothetical protein
LTATMGRHGVPDQAAMGLLEHETSVRRTALRGGIEYGMQMAARGGTASSQAVATT